MYIDSEERIESAPGFQMDWRFFVDLPEKSAILLVVNDALDSKENCYSRVFAGGDRICDHLKLVTYSDFFRNNDLEGEFDIVSLLGDCLPYQSNSNKLLEKVFHQGVKCISKDGGKLCFMFGHVYNPLNIIRLNRQKEQFFSPKDVEVALFNSGYSYVESYGVVPNHKDVRYIFPMQLNIMRFVFDVHYGRKLYPFFKGIIVNDLSVSLLKYLLPSYLVIASLKKSVGK